MHHVTISPLLLLLLLLLLLSNSPPPPGHLLLGPHAAHADTNHGLPEPLAALGQHLGVAVVRRGAYDGLGALGRVARLEDAAADEDAVAAELHHEGGVGRRGHTAGRKVDYRQPAQLGRLLEQGGVDLELAGERADRQVAALLEGGLGAADVAVDLAHVLDGLDDVAGAGLALGADHGGALGDAAQGLAEVAAAADEGDLEGGLLDVEGVVGRGQDLALVDVVHAQGLEDLALDEVADAGLGHDGDRHGRLDLLDLARVRHARHAALGPDVGGDALERHDGARAGLLGDARLRGVRHVHDDAALQHLRQAGLDDEVRLGGGGGYRRVAIGGAYVVVRHGCFLIWESVCLFLCTLCM